ncbi:MAG: hypothetical protein ABFE07_28585 [Armatimonadia bacterium]
MIWFIRESYRYVAPHGFWEHVQFVYLLPWAAVRYTYFNWRYRRS